MNESAQNKSIVPHHEDRPCTAPYCCLRWRSWALLLRSRVRLSGVRKADRGPDVVYWPTPEPVVDKMLELAQVKKGDVVYDLGCGDARILVKAAKKYGAKGFGFDIDPRRISESRENITRNKVENLVSVKRSDIFKVDLKDADVVTLYLLPELNVKLMPQLEKLKPGADRVP